MILFKILYLVPEFSVASTGLIKLIAQLIQGAVDFLDNFDDFAHGSVIEDEINTSVNYIVLSIINFLSNLLTHIN